MSYLTGRHDRPPRRQRRARAGRDSLPATVGEPRGARARALALRAPRPELLALLALAAVLNLWALSRNGWANDYYSAAVRSMSSSWHDFLFASLDQSGVMTVDKPPLALWVQSLSVRVFGFHSLSMLVPQALMGVASVALVYDLVRRRFGRVGGFVGRSGAGADADHGRRSPATTTPTRCWCSAAWPRCGARCARFDAAPHARARAGWCSRASAWASASRRRWASRWRSSPASPPPGCGSRPAARGRLHALRQLLARRRARCCSSAAPGRRSSN